MKSDNIFRPVFSFSFLAHFLVKCFDFSFNFLWFVSFRLFCNCSFCLFSFTLSVNFVRLVFFYPFSSLSLSVFRSVCLFVLFCNFFFVKFFGKYFFLVFFCSVSLLVFSIRFSQVGNQLNKYVGLKIC